MGYYTYIRDTIDFIEENLCEQLSLELISARLYLLHYLFLLVRFVSPVPAETGMYLCRELSQ